MRIAINFSTLKTGGGQNVALNFLKSFNQQNLESHSFLFIVVKNSEIDKALKSLCYSIIYAPSNPIKRIFFESVSLSKVLKSYKVDIVYSYFGYAFISTKILQVSGSADSNLFYPEINFWSGYKGFKLVKKSIVDWYRKIGLKRSHAIIFENKELEERYKRMFDSKKPTTTILPSIFIEHSNKKLLFPIQSYTETAKKGLFLCGWQLNKNVMLIPELAKAFKEIGLNFHFILTAPPDKSDLHLEFIKLCKIHGVEEMITIYGPINKEELMDLYSNIDFVFLLSKLESFSNNIIEAFTFMKPLIISDEQWAKNICNDAAIYVDRNNPNEIVAKVKTVLDNQVYMNNIIQNGTIELRKYPTIDQKVFLELEFLKYVYECSN